MASGKIGHSIAVAVCLSSFVSAQDEAETCYGPGSVVGAVVGTSIVIIGLLVSGFFLYKMYWKNRKGKHLVLMTDAETPHDQYAFDNPCFREATPIKHAIEEVKQNTKTEKVKWPGWPPVHTFGKEKKSEKITSMDDSYINDSRLKVVTLKSHDFTGLGFNICGNMRDGIFVKDVLHRGPAFESGCINTGDRIDSVCISFRNMVFEDALTILSYASPYDVQVQVENDSHSRPSTLMRSKRESNAVNSSERILHPKFNRSQSFSHLNEMERNNKKMSHQTGSMLEKNRINQSHTKAHDLVDFPVSKISSPGNDWKMKNVALRVDEEKSPKVNGRDRPDETPQNKLQKFGIKVLPISTNPKMGVQSVAGTKRPGKSPTGIENEINQAKETPGRTKEAEMERKTSGPEEIDSSKENVRTMLAKGFFNLKEKINQNTLGKKKKGEEDGKGEGEETGDGPGGAKQESESDCPTPKLRSSVPRETPAGRYEKHNQNQMNVPEEVSRAGDVARNNRKSAAEVRKSSEESDGKAVDQEIVTEPASDSEESSDREFVKDGTKKPKKSKGKAPAPPKQGMNVQEMNEIKKESELIKDEKSIFEPEAKIISLKDGDKSEKALRPSYDSDSDTEPTNACAEGVHTKIELNATQVTVHQSPAGDSNEEDVEPSRKAASLGDLSKLDSEQPLSVVLERAVSLDLTEGTSQSVKKRKAPPPPSEEYPTAFDGLSYRKEPRLEGLNTFQTRLKKSSDFGTLEDAICDGPKSLEAQTNKHSPLDLMEAHNNNIQEFSSWLAECRRPKSSEGEKSSNHEEKPRVNSTSLINIHSSGPPEEERVAEEKQESQGGNVCFSVNGKNFADFEVRSSSENVNFPGANSRTVVVISQPNSLELGILEKSSPAEVSREGANAGQEVHNGSEAQKDATPPKLPTSPMPTSNTLSTPLSSTLTYITEIKVSTSEREPEKPEPEDPALGSIGERIQKFDSLKGYDPRHNKNHFTESSKIPIRTMKSETGQKVLATIQSLAKESSATKTPEAEYAKRVASLFSNSHKSQDDVGSQEKTAEEIPRANVSSLQLRTSPPKPSKDYSPTKKVPPVVPPRKTETSLTNKSTVTVELPSSAHESPERNFVTFSSFVARNRGEEPDASSRIAFNVKDRGEMNGREGAAAPVHGLYENRGTGDGL